MVKSLLTYLLTGRKLEKKERLFITSIITQKVTFLDGCGLKKPLDLETLIYGTLSHLELLQDCYHIMSKLITSINTYIMNGKNKLCHITINTILFPQNLSMPL